MLKTSLGVIATVLAVMLFSGCTGAPITRHRINSSQPKTIINTTKYIPIAAGETIITDTREITINTVEFSVQVEPENKGTFYEYYKADDGKSFVHVITEVKNLQKTGLSTNSAVKITVDYNDGYTYSGFCVVEERYGFSTFVTIDPLDTLTLHHLIECPKEVEDNTRAPLFLILTVEDAQYQYTIR